MQQNSGFENRHIDAYNHQFHYFSDSSGRSFFYAPLSKSEKSGDSTVNKVVFPGEKNTTLSSLPVSGNVVAVPAPEFPFLFLISVIFFVLLKNRLRCSLLSIMAMGIYPKILPENERRQIDRGQWIINLFDLASCFFITIILYGFIIRVMEVPGFIYNLAGVRFFAEFTLLERMFVLLTLGIAVFGFFYLKNLFLILFGMVFNYRKDMKEYRKTSKVFLASLIPVGIIIVACIFFAPLKMIYITVVIALIYFLAMFVIKIISGSGKIFSPLNSSNIHIFLYLCTLEFLPPLVIGNFLYVSVR